MDKIEFLNTLIGEGFDASLYNGGIPTIFVDDVSKIKGAVKDIKRVVKEKEYTQSYGIALSSRKSA